MATAKNIKGIKLQVRVENGSTSSGTTKLKNLNFNKIKLTATDDELYEAGKAISELQTLPLSDIRTVATNELTENG